jgi:THO complex subunit 5
VFEQTRSLETMAPLANNPSQASLALPPLTDPSILRVQETVNQIKLIANRFLELKARLDLSEQDQQQLSIDQRKLLSLKIMLRGFNREMYLENRAVKTSTSEAKAEVDNLYLNLQNLKYEQQHLRSEIQDCRNYVY